MRKRAPRKEPGESVREIQYANPRCARIQVRVILTELWEPRMNDSVFELMIVVITSMKLSAVRFRTNSKTGVGVGGKISVAGDGV